MLAGRVVEVRTELLGSQVVEDVPAGATSVTVEDPTPFDTSGGQVVINEALYTWTAVVEVPDPDEPESTNGVLTITPALAADAVASTPVQVWIGTQIHDRIVLGVDFGDGEPPVDVYVRADKRAQWSSLEGPVDPPIDVQLTDDLTDVLDAPGYRPALNGADVWNPYLARRMTSVLVPDNTWFTPSAWADSISQAVTSTTTNVVVDVRGFYAIDAQVAWATNGSGRRFIQILVNGTAVGVDAGAADPDSSSYNSCFGREVLEVGDVVEIQIKQTSGAALFISAGVGRCRTSLYRVSV